MNSSALLFFFSLSLSFFFFFFSGRRAPEAAGTQHHQRPQTRLPWQCGQSAPAPKWVTAGWTDWGRGGGGRIDGTREGREESGKSPGDEVWRPARQADHWGNRLCNCLLFSILCMYEFYLCLLIIEVTDLLIRLIRDGEKGGKGYGGGGKGRLYIYLSPHCHLQNDSCIKVDSSESHFNLS